jgi:hypothetical protein
MRIPAVAILPLLAACACFYGTFIRLGPLPLAPIRKAMLGEAGLCLRAVAP